MKFRILLVFLMVFTGSNGDNVDATFILNQSVALNTKKMSEALKGQDVVATCRYLLYKTYLDWHDAKDSCQNVTLPMTRKKRSSMATVKTKEENKIDLNQQVANIFAK